MSIVRLLVAAMALSVAACSQVPPRQIYMSVVMTGDQQVPPTKSAGHAHGSVSYNRFSRQIAWSIDYSGLTSPLQAAHIHAPAGPGETAAIVATIPVTYSPLVGVAALDEVWLDDLLSGRFYVVFRTPSYPEGEIRGQVFSANLM